MLERVVKVRDARLPLVQFDRAVVADDVTRPKTFDAIQPVVLVVVRPLGQDDLIRRLSNLGVELGVPHAVRLGLDRSRPVTLDLLVLLCVRRTGLDDGRAEDAVFGRVVTPDVGVEDLLEDVVLRERDLVFIEPTDPTPDDRVVVKLDVRRCLAALGDLAGNLGVVGVEENVRVGVGPGRHRLWRDVLESRDGAVGLLLRPILFEELDEVRATGPALGDCDAEEGVERLVLLTADDRAVVDEAARRRKVRSALATHEVRLGGLVVGLDPDARFRHVADELVDVRPDDADLAVEVVVLVDVVRGIEVVDVAVLDEDSRVARDGLYLLGEPG